MTALTSLFKKKEKKNENNKIKLGWFVSKEAAYKNGIFQKFDAIRMYDDADLRVRRCQSLHQEVELEPETWVGPAEICAQHKPESQAGQVCVGCKP